MPNHISPSICVHNNSISLLEKVTGIRIGIGKLVYRNGYNVMLNNNPNTSFKSYFKTKHRIDWYTKIENMKSKYTTRNAFLITSYNGIQFKVAFENNELVQMYNF
jgi:hypothetical protein